MRTKTPSSPTPSSPTVYVIPSRRTPSPTSGGSTPQTLFPLFEAIDFPDCLSNPAEIAFITEAITIARRLVLSPYGRKVTNARLSSFASLISTNSQAKNRMRDAAWLDHWASGQNMTIVLQPKLDVCARVDRDDIRVLHVRLDLVIAGGESRNRQPFVPMAYRFHLLHAAVTIAQEMQEMILRTLSILSQLKIHPQRVSRILNGSDEDKWRWDNMVFGGGVERKIVAKQRACHRNQIYSLGCMTSLSGRKVWSDLPSSIIIDLVDGKPGWEDLLPLRTRLVPDKNVPPKNPARREQISNYIDSTPSPGYDDHNGCPYPCPGHCHLHKKTGCPICREGPMYWRI